MMTCLRWILGHMSVRDFVIAAIYKSTFTIPYHEASQRSGAKSASLQTDVFAQRYTLVVSGAACYCWIGMRGCYAVHAARLKQLKVRRFLCHKAGHCVACCRFFICQQSYLLLFGIPSPTHAFIPGLKPSFSANPSHCSPSFLLLKYLLCGFPGLFIVISEHIFSTFSFSVFTL